MAARNGRGLGRDYPEEAVEAAWDGALAALTKAPPQGGAAGAAPSPIYTGAIERHNTVLEQRGHAAAREQRANTRDALSVERVMDAMGDALRHESERLTEEVEMGDEFARGVAMALFRSGVTFRSMTYACGFDVTTSESVGPFASACSHSMTDCPT